MRFSYQPIRLDTDFGDSRSMLIFRDDRLMAILTCLGEHHEQLAGSWYLEAWFSEALTGPRRSFATVDEFRIWAETLTPIG